MASESLRLSALELDRLYQRRIRADFLDEVPRAPRPTAVFVGGQPGAGSAYAGERVRAHLTTAIGASVVIASGELLPYHPRWRSAGASNPHVDADLRTDIGRWAERLTADAVAQGSNLLLHTGMRHPQSVLAQAGRLRAAGYEVAAVVLATDRDSSRQAMLARFDLGRMAGEAQRFFTAADHDSAYAGLRETLSRLEAQRAVERLQLVARDGRQLYANELADGQWVREPKAVAVLDDFRERPLTARELADSALRWMVLAQRLARDPSVPREVASQATAWRNEAVARAEQDTQAARILAWGREAECFRTMDRQQFLREFSQHAKAVQRLEEAMKYAQENFAQAIDRDRFVAQARERLAERIAEGRFAAPVRDREGRSR